MKIKAMLVLMVNILFLIPLASSSNSGNSTGFELGEIEWCFEFEQDICSSSSVCL
jgi:hypothetical protein